MQGFRKSKGMSFTPFRSAAEEAATKRSNDTKRSNNQSSEDERGRGNGPAPRIVHVADAELPYVVVLTDSLGHAQEPGFATMREAEAFIKRSTPARPGGKLWPLYDRPAGG